VYAVSLPDEYFMLTNWWRAIVAFDLFVLVEIECVAPTFVDVLVLSSTWPLALVVLVIIGGACVGHRASIKRALMTTCSGSCYGGVEVENGNTAVPPLQVPSTSLQQEKSAAGANASNAKRKRSAWLLGLPFALVIIFCLVPGISRTIFSAWSCTAEVYDSSTGEEHTFLFFDPSVRCTDDNYASDEHNHILVYVRLVTLKHTLPPCNQQRACRAEKCSL
jgi:hypothetical protein